MEKPTGDDQQVVPRMKTYSWTQTDDDVTVVFATHKPVLHKSDVECQLTRDSIDLRLIVAGQTTVLMSGRFEHAVDVDASAWTVEGPK